jgi:uncharacterized protein
VLEPAPEPSSSEQITPESAPAVAQPRPILPVERLGALIEVILCSGFPTQLLVFATLTQFGFSARTSDGGLSPPFIVVWALTDMVLVLGLVYVFLRAHREPLPDFILGGRPPLRETLLGAAMIPAAFAVVVVVLAVILAIEPSLHNVPVNPFERMLQTPRDAAIFAVVVMLAGGVREEVQRGFIIRRFDQYLGGGLLGIALYSVLFGLGHIEQGYAAAIATGTLGAVWGLIYRARGSIVAPIISHAGFNLAQLLKYAAVVG